MKGSFIPPRTRAKLRSPAPQGHRHEQIKNLVLPLLGAGLTAEAVFVQMREMYDQDVSDREIRDLIAWGASKSPTPCGYGHPTRSYNSRPSPTPSR
jgi:hypothetical protein